MIGIIANPASGKDIRRLVAQGTVFDNMEKVNIIQRILVALEWASLRNVWVMPDSFQIVARAQQGLKRNLNIDFPVNYLPMDLNNDQTDSTQAARLLEEMGASCIITLGGDGTNRAVAKGCGEVPLIPLSTGTNNVFPQMLEGTVAGLAAAMAVAGPAGDLAKIQSTKLLKIYCNGMEVDSALIDVVVTRDRFVGSRAIWDPERIEEILVTVARPDNIGMSAVAGSFHLIGAHEAKGLYIRTGKGGFDTWAAIAPGIIRQVGIKEHREIYPGQRVPIVTKPGLLALDGERELAVGISDLVEVELSEEGPKLVDVGETLAAAVKRGLFQREVWKNC